MPLHARVGEKVVAAGSSAVVDLGPIRVHVTCGVAAGPRFFLVAGLHGDESLSVHIADEVAATLDPRELSGVVFVVPRAAAAAIERGARHLEGCGDLNRSFPGKEDGNLAERIARVLFKDVIAKCDYGLDLHDAGDHRVGVAHARGALTNHHIRRLCESFGATTILDGEGPPRSLRRTATTFGIPTFAFEAGHGGRADKTMLQDCVRGAFGVMSDLRMLGTEIPWRGAPAVLRDARWVAARKAGKLHGVVHPGHTVRAGEVVARVDDEAMSSPKAGIVLTATHERAVVAGAPICEIASVAEQPTARAVGLWEQ